MEEDLSREQPRARSAAKPAVSPFGNAPTPRPPFRASAAGRLRALASAIALGVLLGGAYYLGRTTAPAGPAAPVVASQPAPAAGAPEVTAEATPAAPSVDSTRFIMDSQASEELKPMPAAELASGVQKPLAPAAPAQARAKAPSGANNAYRQIHLSGHLSGLPEHQTTSAFEGYGSSPAPPAVPATLQAQAQGAIQAQAPPIFAQARRRARKYLFHLHVDRPDKIDDRAVDVTADGRNLGWIPLDSDGRLIVGPFAYGATHEIDLVLKRGGKPATQSCVVDERGGYTCTTESAGSRPTSVQSFIGAGPITTALPPR